MRIKLKPLSVNKAWQGKRFKTEMYKSYEELVWFWLPNKKMPKGKLELHLTFGFSSKNSDIDNPVKPFVDILQKKYGFNDRQIYRLKVEKVDVKKGSEFIKFIIKKYE